MKSIKCDLDLELAWARVLCAARRTGTMVPTLLTLAEQHHLLSRSFKQNMSLMRAVVYGAGGAPTLHEDVAKPVPNCGQILIKVEAASLNPVDYKLGTMPIVGGQLRGRASACLIFLFASSQLFTPDVT